MRILTLNTLYIGDARARIGALGRILDESDYDVVCLQELLSPANLTLLRRLAKSYDHVIHGPRYPVTGGGLVTLSRLPVVAQRFKAYGLLGRPRTEWLIRKGVLTTHITAEDRTVIVVNTHLSANKAADWSRGNAFEPVQTTELNRLATEIAEAGSADPLIVVGDFNVPRDSWLFEDFTAATKLRDAFAGSAETTFRPTPTWPGRALDQVLASPELAVDARLVFQDQIKLADGRPAFLSDHYGIEADVDL